MARSASIQIATTPGRPPTQAWWDRPSPWMVLLVFAAAVAAYWPVFGAGYIWDDPGHVTRPELRSLGGLARIWFEIGATQQYYPLLHSAFWIEARLWGDAPFGYHLVNVLLHAFAACLFAGVLRRLAVPGSWLAALLFVLHPVAVESVAWVSEQKNTLSAVLYLGAALAYLRYDRTRGSGDYARATLLFFLALCTKTVAATLPAALLVVAWWQRGRLDRRRDLLPLVPWFALSLGAGITTAWVEHTLIGASGAGFALGPAERVLLAGRAFWFYLGKLFWPADLMFVYPRWTIDGADLAQYAFPALAIALLGAAWWWRRRGVVAVLLLFGGTLFPALGFIDVYPFIYSFVADHFQYLADLAIQAALAAGGVTLLRRLPAAASIGLVAAMALTLGGLTWRQARVYGDEFTLYETTLSRNPSAWMAHTNLGIALAAAGRGSEAIPHHEAALKLHPDYPEGENNLGSALNAEGRSAEALPHLERAVKLRPNYSDAHSNLGVALMNLGRAAEGRGAFEAALRLNPRFPEAHLNLGLALAKAGRTEEGIRHFAEAVRLRPRYAEAELNWAIGLTLTDSLDEAFTHFRRAVELNPESASIHVFYGRALARARRLDEALSEYALALELNPNSGEAHFNRALALRQLGRAAEAARAFNAAAQLGVR